MATATRRVFIVTCPLELPLLPRSQNPHLTVDSVPRIADSLGMFGLTKHWEVCVEAAPGSSDSITKLFGKARYFGGPGPSWWKGGDDGLSWDADRVAHIEAVELVGETRLSDAEINEIGRFRWANFPRWLATQIGLIGEPRLCRGAAQKRVGRVSSCVVELPGL